MLPIRLHSTAVEGARGYGENHPFACRIAHRLVLIFSFFLILVPVVFADETPDTPGQAPQQNKRDGRERLGKEWSAYGDLVGTYDPRGIELSGGINYKNSYRYDERYEAVSSYWLAGGGLDLTPAYAEPSLAFEWMPALFLVTRAEYDGYYYFGAFGSLLSFPSGTAPFGAAEHRARRGTEESGFGSRLFFQPTVQLKAGDFVLRNQTDLARYRFPGQGPFFLEQEYDTLLRDGDRLVANRTQVLMEFDSGTGWDTFLGPYYEIVHAETADLTRKRIGILYYSEQTGKERPSDSHHYFAEIGYNLKDPNRQHGIFLLFGIGGSKGLR